jgi:hypothetical protein
MIEEEKDINDIDSFDPEDEEVDVDDEFSQDDEFVPASEDSDPEENESVDTTLDEGGSTIDEEEEVLDEDVKKYLITGLVDYTDDAGNIVGQYPKDSIQLLPESVGQLAVEAGQAEEVE